MEQKIEVGILGATGMVGQHFISFLEGHPWFELTWLGASDRSAGKKYREATNWRLDGATPDDVADITVEDCKPGNAPKLLFLGDGCFGGDRNRAGFRARRATLWCRIPAITAWNADVPLLVPEINAEHLKLFALQQTHARMERADRDQSRTARPSC